MDALAYNLRRTELSIFYLYMGRGRPCLPTGTRTRVKEAFGFSDKEISTLNVVDDYFFPLRDVAALAYEKYRSMAAATTRVRTTLRKKEKKKDKKARSEANKEALEEELAKHGLSRTSRSFDKDFFRRYIENGDHPRYGEPLQDAVDRDLERDWSVNRLHAPSANSRQRMGVQGRLPRLVA